MRYVLWVGFVYSLFLSFAPIPTAGGYWIGSKTVSVTRCGYFFPWITWSTKSETVLFLSARRLPKPTAQLATKINLLALHPPGFDEEKFHEYMKGKKTGTYGYNVPINPEGANPISLIFYLLWNGGLLVCLMRNYRFRSDQLPMDRKRTAYFCDLPIANLLWLLLVFHLCVSFVPVPAFSGLIDIPPGVKSVSGGFFPIVDPPIKTNNLKISFVLNLLWNLLLLMALTTNHRISRRIMSESSVLT